jgi:hypothetical protein
MNKSVLSCFIIALSFWTNYIINAQKKEKDPLDLLKAQWGQFDFHFGDNWEIERMSTFLLKSREFVEDYYALLKDSAVIDEELMKNDIHLIRQYVIIGSIKTCHSDKMIITISRIPGIYFYMVV